MCDNYHLFSYVKIVLMRVLIENEGESGARRIMQVER